MVSAAYITHPLDNGELTQGIPFGEKIPHLILEKTLRYLPVRKVAEIMDFRNPEGQLGWVVNCPLTTKLIQELPGAIVQKKFADAGKMAVNLGAKVIGLHVNAGQASREADLKNYLLDYLGIPIIEGQALAIYLNILGVKEILKKQGRNFADCQIVVLGVNNPLGEVLVQFISREVRHLSLIQNDSAKINRLARRILYDSGLALKVTEQQQPVKNADIVFLTSTLDIVDPKLFKQNALVCDFATSPKLVGKLEQIRPDLKLMQQAMVALPQLLVEHITKEKHQELWATPVFAETLLCGLSEPIHLAKMGDININYLEEVVKLAQKYRITNARFPVGCLDKKKQLIYNYFLRNKYFVEGKHCLN